MRKLILTALGAFIATIILAGSRQGSTDGNDGKFLMVAFAVLLVFLGLVAFLGGRQKFINGMGKISPRTADRMWQRIENKRRQSQARDDFDKSHRAYRRKMAVYQFQNPNWKNYYNQSHGQAYLKPNNPKGHIPGFTSTPPPPPPRPRPRDYQ